MSDIDISRITIFAMELHPDSQNTAEAVFSLLCSTCIAYANELDLLSPTGAPQPHPRLTIASTLDAAKENVFALIDAIEGGTGPATV